MFERYECESSTLRTVPSHVEGAVQWAINSETRNCSEAMHCGCRLPRRVISADVPITVYGGPFVHLLSHALIARTATLIGLPHFSHTVAL